MRGVLDNNEIPRIATILIFVFDKKKPDTYGYVYGLGGRDVTTGDIRLVFDDLKKVKSGKSLERNNYLGVRE